MVDLTPAVVAKVEVITDMVQDLTKQVVAQVDLVAGQVDQADRTLVLVDRIL